MTPTPDGAAMRVAALLLVLLLPAASAQVPDTREAEDAALGLVCAVPVDLGVCPAPPVAQPAAGWEAEPPRAVRHAADPVEEIHRAAGDVVEDPATAPDRVGDVLAAFLAFLEDLLDLPGQVSAALSAAIGGMAGTLADAAAQGTGALAGQVEAGVRSVGDVVAKAGQALAALLSTDAAPPATTPRPEPGRGGCAAPCAEVGLGLPVQLPSL